METISAVRYRQYYNQWLQSQDFYDALAQLAYLIVTARQTIHHELMSPSSSKTTALIVIGSDRGLCGAYNSNINKLLEVHLNMSRRFGRKLDIYVKGRKPLAYLNNRGIEIKKDLNDLPEVPDSSRVRDLADDLINQFTSGQIGRLAFVYTRFYSAASQQAQTLTMLPVADLIDDLTTRSTVIWPWELDFEDFLLHPGPEEIFGSIATMMIRAAISSCFLEAALSEHLSRVVAMRSATDNAAEMIEDLTLEYNRARQGQITVELLDIIGGVEAAAKR
jgi:F-type H+-transporting ATPase subunit gamma